MTTPPTSAEPTEAVVRTMRTFSTELARFNTAGLGTIRDAAVRSLHKGEIIAVTDDDADTFEAEVLDVTGDAAAVCVRWDRVLHRA